MKNLSPQYQCYQVLWQAGWQASIWNSAKFIFFKIKYRMKYLTFCDVCQCYSIIIVIPMLYLCKGYSEVDFRHAKILAPFFHVNPYYLVLLYLMIPVIWWFYVTRPDLAVRPVQFWLYHFWDSWKNWKKWRYQNPLHIVTCVVLMASGKENEKLLCQFFLCE